MDKRKTIGALFGIAISALLIWGWDDDPKSSYYRNEGKVFGTYYNIRYEATEDLGEAIERAFEAFDNSLSLFNPHSILSAINDNRDTVTNATFEQMWSEAERVYALSDGRLSDLGERAISMLPSILRQSILSVHLLVSTKYN